MNRILCTLALLAAALLLSPSRAEAEIVLSQLVVDIAASKAPRGDIEVWNNDSERVYLLVEPSEVLRPGTPSEQRITERDPERLGLLVSPRRMVLEPGERKLLRLSPIAATPVRERVYRVTVRPTVGPLEANTTGLKVMIGYDVLVLVRPADASPKLSSRRENDNLIIRNEGNSSVELSAGKACSTKLECRDLPGKRLYAGAEWRVQAPSEAEVTYAVVSPWGSIRRDF